MAEHRKVTCILGTRPEAIKMVPVILALKGRSGIDCRVCVTGQHREMLDQALHALDIIPDEDLNLMRQNQTIGELTASAISSLDQFMIKERPDLILVQGAPSISRSSTIGSGARLGYLSPAAYERRFYADRAAA